MSGSEYEEVFTSKPRVGRSPLRTRSTTKSLVEKHKSESEKQEINSPAKSAYKTARPTLPVTTRTTRTIARNLRIETEATTNQESTSKDISQKQTNTTTTELQVKGNEIVINLARKSNQIIETKMNQRDIQRNIAAFVPEFSGQNTEQRDNELSRFFGTADSIREMLTTDEERKIFDQIIKFRLTGDAYIRMMDKDIKDYDTFKTTLENMYRRSETLEELENRITKIQQSYGETCRNYGYRLMEALDRYRKGYKAKYNLAKIDETYDKHLDTSAVHTFKRGINNTILKEKVATIRADTIEQMITEVEITEKMLELTTDKPNNQQQGAYRSVPQSNQNPVVICNYCQKANHTWDVCRARLFNNRNAQQTRGQHTNQRYNQYTNRPRDNYNPTNNYGRYLPQQYRFPSTQQSNQQMFQPKYCSFCKTTKGHTFEECRSKLLPNRTNTQNNYQNTNNNDYKYSTNNNRNHQTNATYGNQNTTNYNRANDNPGTGRFIPSTSYNNANRTQRTDTRNLEEQFGNLKINMITPQQSYEANHNQGNDSGSNQQ